MTETLEVEVWAELELALGHAPNDEEFETLFNNKLLALI